MDRIIGPVTALYAVTFEPANREEHPNWKLYQPITPDECRRNIAEEIKTMTDQNTTQTEAKKLTTTVKRTTVVDELENGMLVINEKTYCGSAEQFHEGLKLHMQHPFADAPKQKRTRGPNQPKQAAKPEQAKGKK